MKIALRGLGLVVLVLVVLASAITLLEIVRDSQLNFFTLVSMLPAFVMGAIALFLLKKYYPLKYGGVKTSSASKASVLSRAVDGIGYLVGAIFFISGVFGLFIPVYPKESGSYNLQMAVLCILVGSAVIWKVRSVRS